MCAIFSFTLLSVAFINLIILIPFYLSITNLWTFFIKNNFYAIRLNPSSIDTLKHSKIFKKLHYNFFLLWFIPIILILSVSNYFIHFDIYNIWYNHIKYNNYISNIILLVVITGVIIFNIIKFIKNKNINFNIDYFLSIFNIILVIPILYNSNTFYTFIFILETISILIIYKFAVSKFFLKNENFFDKTQNVFEKNISKNYLNMMFFQYWANFFSSVSLFFFVFNILYMYSLSDWFLLNYINNFIINYMYINTSFLITFLLIIFLLGFFLKIGFTPSHLFKIEVYKGIPFISVFFYTTIYFISFFLFFIIIINIYMTSYNIYIWFFFSLFLLIGLFYVIFLLFDVNNLKSFFAYSTVVNTLTFLTVLLSSIY